jgi:hypothetical protein
MVPPTGAPKAAHAAPLIQTRGAACRNHLSQASQKNNQRNRKANDHNRANCHNVVCNKVSILELMPRHPHSFEPPRNCRCPRMNDEAPISRLGRGG